MTDDQPQRRYSEVETAAILRDVLDATRREQLRWAAAPFRGHFYDYMCRDVAAGRIYRVYQPEGEALPVFAVYPMAEGEVSPDGAVTGMPGIWGLMELAAAQVPDAFGQHAQAAQANLAAGPMAQAARRPGR